LSALSRPSKHNRAALDFDAGFVNSFVPAMIDDVIAIDE
jgi:hypothetical protein